MRETEKEIIEAYISAQRDRYADEIIKMQQRIRYRKIDVVDLVEYMLLLERAAAFNEFAEAVSTFIHINDKRGV